MKFFRYTAFRLFSSGYFHTPAKPSPQNKGGVQKTGCKAKGGCKACPSNLKGGAKLNTQRRGGVQSWPRRAEGGYEVDGAKLKEGAKPHYCRYFINDFTLCSSFAGILLYPPFASRSQLCTPPSALRHQLCNPPLLCVFNFAHF